MTKTHEFEQVGRSDLEPQALDELDEMDRVFKKAVEGAREDNRRRGLPSPFVKDGVIVEELPDGTVRAIDMPSNAPAPSPDQLVKK